MFDFARDGDSVVLKTVDLMENEKSWAQNSVLIESLEMSVTCSKVVAKLHSSPANFYCKF